MAFLRNYHIGRKALVWGTLLSLTLLLLPGNHSASVDALETSTESRLYPNEFEWIKRTYPHYQYDEEAYRRTVIEAANLRFAAKRPDIPEWESVGPTNVPGRITDVEYDPLNPSTAYAGSATGGVYKSVDSGETWTPIFDDQPTMSIGDVAVDPINPDVVYVGTGEANGGHNTMRGFGIFKSVDEGISWTASGLEEAPHISRILIDPKNPERVFASAIGSYFGKGPHRGVYRSTNAGYSWEQVLFLDDSTGVIDLAMRPNNPDVLFAASWTRLRTIATTRFWEEANGVYRSTNGGDTWQRLGEANGLPVSDRVMRIGLSICRDRPDIMYALYTGRKDSGSSNDYYGLYRSDDGGDTWRDADPDRGANYAFAGFSWYFGQVRVAPDDPDVVFVLDVLLGRSDDGGKSWTHTAGTHVDYHAMGFHPEDPETVLVGNDGGIAVSHDLGSTWPERPALANAQFYEIGLHPTNPQQFFGGTQDNGTLGRLSTDRWTHILGGDGFYVIVDPVEPTTMYAESQFGNLVKITNYGTAQESLRRITVTDSNEPRNWSTPVVMDPTQNQVLYYGTDRVHRTTDGAETWSEVSSPLVRPESARTRLGTITTMAVSPQDSDVVYAGTDDGKVWKSEDYADSWTDVSSTLPHRWVTRIVPDPVDRNTAYVTYSGRPYKDYEPHVLRTRDLGSTWEDITSNLVQAPVNAFAVDPKDTSRLFAGTDLGAFMSLNAGGTWQLLGNGMPLVPVYDIKIFFDSQAHKLVAGTHGRSMYTLDLSVIPTASDPPISQDASAEVVLAYGFPNPFDSEVTLTYTLPSRGVTVLEIYNVLGRRVQTLVSGYQAAGEHQATWRPGAVAKGMYFARLSHNVGQRTAIRTTTLVQQ